MISKRLLALFTETELELLISGLPTICMECLEKAARFRDYHPDSDPQVKWFWDALRSYDQANLAKFVQFLTGTSKIPFDEWHFVVCKAPESTDLLPSANTW